MSRKAMVAVTLVCYLHNMVALVVNVSLPSKAATPSYQELMDNPGWG
jgi:hypothetical protein